MMSALRIRNLLLGLVVLGAVMAAYPARTVHAEGLQIRPLLYREKLEAGGTKKGFVEVSNATHVPVTVTLDVKTFRQLDGNGTLQFLDSAVIRDAVQLDLTEVELGPREAVRVYFLVDGKKLPSGDVFAAVFAATKPVADSSVAPSAQVGTLLILENGQAGPRKATVGKLAVPWLSMADSVDGTIEVRNAAPANQSTAFFPDMRVSVGSGKGSTRNFSGPLIFAGVTRKVNFSVPVGNRLGIFRLTVEAQGVKKTTRIALVTGYWCWVLPLAIGGGCLVVILVRRRQTQHRRPAAVVAAETPVEPIEAPPEVSPDSEPEPESEPSPDPEAQPDQPVEPQEQPEALPKESLKHKSHAKTSVKKPHAHRKPKKRSKDTQKGKRKQSKRNLS